MIILKRRQDSEFNLLRILQRDNKNVWDIYLRDWFGAPKESMWYGFDFKPTAPITMDRRGLIRFASGFHYYPTRGTNTRLVSQREYGSNGMYRAQVEIDGVRKNTPSTI